MCIICEAGPGCGKPQHRPEMEGPGPPAIVRVRLSKEIVDFEIAGGGREKGGRSPSGCRIQNAPMPPAQRAAVFNTWFLGRPEIFDCGIWAAPKTRETMRKHMGGDAPHICEWFPGPPVPPRDPPKIMLSSRPENPVLIKKRRQIDRPRGYGSPTGPSLGKKAILQTKTFASLSAAVRRRGRFPNSELLPRSGLT